MSLPSFYDLKTKEKIMFLSVITGIAILIWKHCFFLKSNILNECLV